MSSYFRADGSKDGGADPWFSGKGLSVSIKTRSKGTADPRLAFASSAWTGLASMAINLPGSVRPGRARSCHSPRRCPDRGCGMREAAGPSVGERSPGRPRCWRRGYPNWRSHAGRRSMRELVVWIISPGLRRRLGRGSVQFPGGTAGLACFCSRLSARWMMTVLISMQTAPIRKCMPGK